MLTVAPLFGISCRVCLASGAVEVCLCQLRGLGEEEEKAHCRCPTASGVRRVRGRGGLPSQPDVTHTQLIPERLFDCRSALYSDDRELIGTCVAYKSSHHHIARVGQAERHRMNARTSQTHTRWSQPHDAAQPSLPNIHQSTPVANSVCRLMRPSSQGALLESSPPSVHTRHVMS